MRSAKETKDNADGNDESQFDKFLNQASDLQGGRQQENSDTRNRQQSLNRDAKDPSEIRIKVSSSRQEPTTKIEGSETDPSLGENQQLVNNQKKQSSSLISVNLVACKSPADQSPGPTTEQRIKVTLSTPRSSLADATVQPHDLPILLDTSAGADSGRPPAQTIEAEARGQSPGAEQLAAQRTGSRSLSRSERDNELRRIASQRIRPRAAGAEPNEPELSQTQQANKKAATEATAAPLAQQTLASISSDPRKLAIFMNGRIRSDSIFCRSSSSNSFKCQNWLNKLTSSGQSGSQQATGSGKPTKEKKDSGKQTASSRWPASDQELNGCSGLQEAATDLVCSDKRRSKTDDPQAPLCSRKLGRNPTSDSCPEEEEQQLGAGSQQPRGGRHLSALLANYLAPCHSARAWAALGGCRGLCGGDTGSEQKAGILTPRNSSANQEPTDSSARSGSTPDQNSRCKDNELDKEDQRKLELKLEQQKSEHPQQLPANTTLKLNPSSMFLRKAMRYYRLWIYCTNATILLGTLIFVVSAIYVTSDFRIRLLVRGSGSPRPWDGGPKPTAGELQNRTLSEPPALAGQPKATPTGGSIDIRFSYWEPSLLVAYVAVAFQAGLLQAIGCFGALRMRERWIQTFWFTILAMTLFDLCFLGYWLQRYNLVLHSLRSHMSLRLEQNYGHFRPDNGTQLEAAAEWNEKFDKIFTEIIDKIQRDSRCCGIYNSLDFRSSHWRQAQMLRLAERLAGVAPEVAAELPLVPASCCRQPGSEQPQEERRGRRPQGPAWQPSMAVNELRPAGRRHESRRPPVSNEEPTDGEQSGGVPLGEILDSRWSGGRQGRSVARRLLPGAHERYRRWALESWVDEQERVATRFVEELDGSGVWPSDGASRLERLRQLAFGRPTGGTAQEFRWPERLQPLSYEQFRLLESFLEQEEAGRPAESRRQKRNLERRPEERDPGAGQMDRIRRMLAEDPELGCAPVSYYDRAAINTRGCYPEIRAWLESSANTLFVMGFCVLTVLKACSWCLLKLEIKEMIGKIKVLKGMATEYGAAINDLEVYLPRPSLCTQVAELTPGGVTLAASQAAAVTSAAHQLQASGSQTFEGAGGGAAGATGPAVHAHRLGGSFSEAVAAATAAAAAAANQHGHCLQCPGALGIGGLASSGRAASMKAVAAMSNMLAPGLCPRSSSASSSAHHNAFLEAGSWSLGTAFQKLRSPLDPPLGSGSLTMSRRHTAVSVCPAAAAAAHHLMCRRGTYVANPIYGMGAQTAGLQHTHSAQAVPALLNPATQSAGMVSKPAACPTRLRPQHQHSLQHQQSLVGSLRHQSSADSSQCGPPRGSRSGSHQLLPLAPPFKRQSSGGTHSAGNFSFDLAAPAHLSSESRRSIY